MTKKDAAKKQINTAIGLVIFGGCLLVAGFIASPVGVIHPSVLTAFGECLTFSGSVIGIDYSVKKKLGNPGDDGGSEK